ncbi:MULTISPECIES: AMP-binding protein [unclassified Mycobacterium]|uniref:AMP-binding protein n=1 Tax=unclassified Mycobacterium TaxID=2642494 RepID=UPI0029C673FB|nr:MULTISPECIES: AMP-binding protein [unclassified Mycobacterium]
MADYVWNPTADYIEGANVTRLMRAHGVDSLAELRKRSVADIGWYWDAAIRDLALPFRTPYTQLVDLSRGIEHPDWFCGGELNIVDACVHRWAADGSDAERLAVVHEDEGGTVRSLTFRELDQQVKQLAAGLRRLGVERGDAVALLLPMVPEAVVACYAVARLGAILVPLFSGFAPAAIASRLQDADAKVVIVADATRRRGKTVLLKRALDQAIESCPTVEQVIVVRNVDPNAREATVRPREVDWNDVQGDVSDAGPTAMMASAEPLLLAYTSGTTGRPKGAVHTHAGFLVKTASELAYSFDVKRGGVFCWITDMGWIMGALSIIGTHANGATLLLYEGALDVPDSNRLWELAQRHHVDTLGVSPTLIRTIRAAAEFRPGAFDMSSVHTLGSTGETWDPESYTWLARDVFGGRVPIINFSGGTEVGGSFLAPYPVEPIRSCSVGGPSLGMDVTVVDVSGTPVRGQAGELVCRQPWPSMTRGIWKDDARYLESYWSTFPGMWRHGDLARIDEDGQWFILGRSDDVMNVAGKRLASAEVESIVARHPMVAEVAVVGVPDPRKGETVWAFWVPTPDTTEDVSGALAQMIVDELGKPFAPAAVHKIAALPKTRSGKILRRAIRVAILDQELGEFSSAENFDVLSDIGALTIPSLR